MMRWVVRILLGCVAAIMLLCGFAGFYFLVYSADLPDLYVLERYAPARSARVSDPCLPGESIALPYSSIGYNFRSAMTAAEGYQQRGEVMLRDQISRTMLCAPSKNLVRQLKGARIAAQLRWHFSRDELLTIYANRAQFGEDCIGIQAAAEHYFHKQPDQLDIAEAALLAGLIQRPSYLSPYTHADRALQHRNQVIDAMVKDHAISVEQGEAAKATSLSVTPSNPHLWQCILGKDASQPSGVAPSMT